MSWLNSLAIIKELIVVDNKQLAVSHRMVIIHMPQLAFYIYADLKLQNNMYITFFKDKIYTIYKKYIYV
jgi:hypothetical protein